MYSFKEKQYLAVLSVLFSIGGVFFAGVVLCSNSIYSSILWHIFINVGMALSGFILLG